jgi:hypothetical protein
MSEPDSLYLRVHLSKPAYERYLANEGFDARDFPDWMSWLTRAKMYGPPFTPERVAEIGQSVRRRSPAEELKAWTTNAWAIAKSDYDEQTETWRFGILQFSENYSEYLEMLPPLRAVDRFKDRPGVDFMLVYNYLWSPGHYTVLFELNDGRSTIVGSPGQDVPLPERYREEASAFLESLVPSAGRE